MGLSFVTTDPDKASPGYTIPVGGLSRGINNIRNFIPNQIKKGIIKGIVNSNVSDRDVVDAISKGVDDYYKPDLFPDNNNNENKDNTSFDISVINSDLKESLSSDQKELWEREDAIRQHVEEREDSAYQRAVADMKKAGINPELLGVNPANSGGGIIQASRMDTSLLNTDLSGAYSEMIAQLNNEVKVDENQKDRILSIVNNFVDVAGKLLLFKFLKK